MGKPRTKRQQLRDERKAKRKAAQDAGAETNRETKRRRTSDDEGQDDRDNADTDGPRAAKRAHRNPNPDDDYVNDPFGTGADQGRPEREFFGMLDDEEQEYFKRADEMLELNQFPSEEERDVFLQSVYREAVGKELKLASSQSLSRLMERLILLSSTPQKKHIFGAFAGHFLSLVQHRFASHCCEALFLQSAPVVTQELGGAAAFVVDTAGRQQEGEVAAGAEPENSMENLFLMTLDEFEEHLGYLLTDRFASHTLRVLLIVLSGRSLEDSATRTLLKSKKKERISVHGAPNAGNADEPTNQLRAVPASFTMATRKIIEDATAGMDFTALRILVKHPTGNPLLQLLLELDIALNHKSDKAKTAASDKETLLYRLLPGAPMSLANGDSQAADFVNSVVYDPIGSRILETLLTHAPGKLFRALHQNFFAPRMATYVRNDIASYPALRALNRLGKDDLVAAVHSILPAVPVLVAKARYNILKTLFQRCQSWMGRSVWRTWKGDVWKTRHADWVRWAKEVEGGSAGAAGAEGEVKLKPWEKMREKNREKARARGGGGGGGGTEATTGANSVEVAEEAA
ncbi:UPF0364 protein [Verticillium dahliae VDG2]|nr:UPF0364 protein [Verticillium dahliae VDG2]